MVIRSLTAACALAALLLTSNAASARELIYGAWLHPQHGVVVHALTPYLKDVEREAGGEIRWELVPGGQLASGRGMLAAIRDRVIDAGGSIIPSYTPRELGASNVVMGTMVFGDETVAASAAAVETIMLHCPECMDEYRKQNAVFLGGYTATPFYLMCAKPVTSLAEAKNLRVRTSGAGVRLVRMMGASPVAMSPADALTAMQRGAVDCVMGSPAWLESWGFKDVVTHFLDYPLGIVAGLGMMTMNRAVWDSLTREQKQAHLKPMPLAMARAIIPAYIDEDERILKEAIADGLVVTKGGSEFDELVARFEEAEESEIVKAGRELGVVEPERVMRAYRQAVEKWKGLAKEIGHDVEAYAGHIQREIFDKLDVDKL